MLGKSDDPRRPSVPPPFPKVAGTCCWCGKPVEKPRRFWHPECQAEWWHANGAIRSKAIEDNRSRHAGRIRCDACGKELEKYEPDYSEWLTLWENLQVDHILAIALGGHPTARGNLQVLCVPCHKNKTAQDRAKIARLKGSARYGARRLAKLEVFS